MNLQTIIAVIGIIAFYLWARSKTPDAGAEDPEQPFFDSARLQNEVNSLHRCMQELEQLDEMIIDLRLCKPEELHRAFRVNWHGSTGKEHTLDFMSTGGNGNTLHMIELAEGRRDELNEEIQERIVDLYTRAQSMEFYSRYDAESTERSYQNSEQNDAKGECFT